MVAKDYFQDILPPQRLGSSAPKKIVRPETSDNEQEDTSIPITRDEEQPQKSTAYGSERSIRNISMPARPKQRTFEDPLPRDGGPRKGSSMKHWWVWIVAGTSVVLLGLIALFALRTTTVTVTTRVHEATFDSSAQYTAYPESSSVAGTLSYTLQSIELEDSEVVPSEGTVQVSEKAAGNITVYNNHQATPLKLVKDTRFETPGGLIFRTPAEVVVPAKKGSTPGQVTITVIA